jgi:hypothetical protein
MLKLMRRTIIIMRRPHHLDLSILPRANLSFTLGFYAGLILFFNTSRGWLSTIRTN